MKKLYWLIMGCILLTLLSCSIFSPVPVESQNKYVLNSLPSSYIKKSHRAITLMVTEPDTKSFYNTRLMAYTTSPYQIAYFAKSTWISEPADMLQPLIIQALQNTHHYHAVISPAVAGRYQYRLNTQIEELLQDYTHVTAILRFTIRADIVRALDNKVIATKRFVVIQPILQRSPYGGVLAANQATAEILRQLTQFCLKNT